MSEKIHLRNQLNCVTCALTIVLVSACNQPLNKAPTPLESQSASITEENAQHSTISNELTSTQNTENNVTTDVQSNASEANLVTAADGQSADTVTSTDNNQEESFHSISDDEFFASLTEQQEQDIADRAYPLKAAIWPGTNIFVCWEEMPEEFSELREVVRTAIQGSWEAVSALAFKGWVQCTENSSGIRIAIEDTGPHVKSIGKFISGKKNGMILNFTFENWGQGCKAKIASCIQMISIHEFGHAIGYAHEQNRPDTPGDCDKQQGTDGDDISLTPWDLESVMNYCDPNYGNNGKLSRYDVFATQQIYGET